MRDLSIVAFTNSSHDKSPWCSTTSFSCTVTASFSNPPVANESLDFSIFKASYAPLFRKEDLFSFALSDPASLHSVLVHSALNLCSMRQINPDPDMLYHQGETIRLINDRLGDPDHRVATDTTIFTVANMTHLEVCFLLYPAHCVSGSNFLCDFVDFIWNVEWYQDTYGWTRSVSQEQRRYTRS